MAAIDKIDKIKKISKKISPEAPTREPNKDYFEALMKQRRVETETVQKTENEPAKKANSIFDEVRELNHKVHNVTHSSHEELLAQSEDVIGQIESLKEKLATPNLEIKGSVQRVLKDKLTHIDESLKIALDKAGIEYKPPPKPTSLSTPMDRFLGLLTHSQHQLETLAGDVKIMAETDTEFTPANMLLIQVKVAQVQQQIELFTSMLNKALESTKTIMNVQV